MRWPIIVGSVMVVLASGATIDAQWLKPWTVTLRQRLVVDTELLDCHCTDNERSAPHMIGK